MIEEIQKALLQLLNEKAVDRGAITSFQLASWWLVSPDLDFGLLDAVEKSDCS
jgi:hypothetical protein